MKIAEIDITIFRCIKKYEIYLDRHSVFVGDNNAGKSTVSKQLICRVPDRSSKYPNVDE